MSIRRALRAGPRPLPSNETLPILFIPSSLTDATRRDAIVTSENRSPPPPPRCHSRSVRSAWRFAVSDSRLLVRKHLQLHPVLVSPPTDASLFLCLSLRFVSRPVYLLLAFLPSIRRILRIRVLLHTDVYVRVYVYYFYQRRKISFTFFQYGQKMKGLRKVLFSPLFVFVAYSTERILSFSKPRS